MKLFGRKKTEKNKKGFKGVVVFFITAVLCVLATIIALSFTPETQIILEEKDYVRRTVSVEEVTPKGHKAIVNLLGEAVPEWRTTIKSRVDGKIISVSPFFRAGAEVKKGEVLLEVENSQYVALLAEAETRLANAKIAYLLEQNESVEAEENWKRAGLKGEPESLLVFRKPQLEAAKNELLAAEVLLAKAKIDLEYTQIKAPFDGSIVERHINLGESILPGETVALFYSTSKLLLTVNVDQKQWSMLPKNLGETDVKLKDTESGSIWNSKISRAGNWLANNTRLRPVVIEIKNSGNVQNPVLAGSFLNVELHGRLIPNTIGVTESALTKGGYVWYVNNDNELLSYKPVPHFYSEGKVYISPPEDISGAVKIAVNPNSTFMNGFEVKPKIVSEGE